MMIQMTQTHRGCDNGFDVRRYEKHAFLVVGEDIGHNLASDMLRKGQARLVDEEVVNRIIACPYLNQW